MKRYASIAALIAATTASAALGQTAVEEVDVTADVTVIENIEAAQAWSGVEADLETAIAERLVGQLEERGARILIDLDTLSLANSFEQSVGIGEHELSGDVTIRVPGIANNENYTLTVSAEQATAFFPEDMTFDTVAVDSDLFYRAMVDAFAENVVGKVQ
ncbi:MAG: hypothetical protein AAGF60_14505 [Pseudomonadota bacterium]